MAKVSVNGVSYDTDAVEAVLRRTREALRGEGSSASAFARAVEESKPDLDFYPPERNQSVPFEFPSDKSRRYFWYAVSRGLIRIPYRRTRRLAEAAELLVLKVTGTSFLIAVNIDLAKAPYAPFVVGTRQVPGHKTTGWSQLYTAVGDNIPGIVRPLEPAYNRELRGYIKGGF